MSASQAARAPQRTAGTALPRPTARRASLLAALALGSGLATDRAAASDPAVDGGSEDAGTSLRDLSKVRQLLDGFLVDEAEVVLVRARAHLAQGELLSALALLREAQELAPRSAPVRVELGQLLLRLGQVDEAWRLLWQAIELGPEQVELHLAVVDLALREAVDPAQLERLAERLHRLRARWPDDPELTRRQARLAARLARHDEAERLFGEALALSAGDPVLLIEMGDLQRERDRLDDALAWYRRVAADGPLAEVARERAWRVEVEQQARRYGLSAGSAVPGPEASALLERGRALLLRLRPREAVPVLQQALLLAPGYSEARLLLGDAWRRQGERQRAELEYLRGLVFDQGSAELHARLGELYLEHVDPNRAQEAIALLGRALQLRPDWAELKLRLAQSLRRSGQLPRALQLAQEYLASAPPEPGLTQALALRESIEKIVQKQDDAQTIANPDESPSSAPAGASADGLRALNRARALLDRGRTAEALAVLQQLDGLERDPRLLALQGRILHAAGQLEPARQAIEASLHQDPLQPALRTQLGAILLGLDQLEQAEASLLQASAEGNAEALLYLAELQLRRARATPAWLAWQQLPALLESRSALAELANRAEGSVPAPPAPRLAEFGSALDRATLRAAGLPLLALGALALLIGWAARRRLGGVDLATLLDRKPELGAQVQRILASIHHEVLKHNTMILNGIIEALASDQASPAQLDRLRALVATEPDAPYRRFLDHVRQLMELGAGAGIRLNIARKDPAIYPIFVGFEILTQVVRALDNRALSQPAARARLLRQLERASVLLNTQAYNKLHELIARRPRARVDEAWLRGLFERAAAEPGLTAEVLAPLDLSTDRELPFELRVPRQGLEDVLVNLLRNAIEASVKEGLSPVVIGLDLRLEQHPITGHQRQVLAVRDRARACPNSDDLRSRPRHRGLGLVHDILEKSGGGLSLRTLTGTWTKEIVVFLPVED